MRLVFSKKRVLVYDSVLAVYKPFGLTPLQTLDLIRLKHPHYQTEKLSYAGRLDPMAEGVMLVLVGEANFRREEYLNLDKEYQFTFLVGVATDSADLLGRINSTAKLVGDQGELEVKAREFLAELAGEHEQVYPTHSSPRLAGQAPSTKLIKIYEAELVKVEKISRVELESLVLNKLDQLISWQTKKDFRQEIIKAEWLKFFSETKLLNYFLVSGRIASSSGTYVRVLAEKFGQFIGEPTCVFSITRTRVGQWTKDSAILLRAV